MGDHADEFIVAFSQADCWVLARALEERYESLTVCVLGSEDEGNDFWVHQLVRDDRDPRHDTFVDIFGQQTADEVLQRWEHDPDWDLLAPITPTALPPNPRQFPQVSVGAAIEHLIRTGWQPPPLKRLAPAPAVRAPGLSPVRQQTRWRGYDDRAGRTDRAGPSWGMR